MKGLMIIVFICSASMAIPVKETKTDVKRIPSAVSTDNQKVPVKVKRSPTFGGGFSNAASFSLNTGWGGGGFSAGFGGSGSSSFAGLGGAASLASSSGFGGPGVSAGFSGSSAFSSAGASGLGVPGDYGSPLGFGLGVSSSQAQSSSGGFGWGW